MTSKLRIVWDGNVPGLEERRLSIGSFGPALRELLAALRRIATDLERDAWPTRLVSSAGRLKKDASNLDIQIVTITGNSPVAVEMDIVEVAQPARPLVHDLGVRAMERFLEDLKLEAAGTAAHYKVRKFLGALPEGLTKQKYTHTDADGRVRREIDLGAVDVAPSKVSAHLIEVIGEIVGVGFEPGRNEVKVKSIGGDVVSFSATLEHIETALSLRGTGVKALGVVEPARVRLLRFGDSPEFSPDARLNYVFSTWAGVLAELAK
jgi:hypothetical protein